MRLQHYAISKRFNMDTPKDAPPHHIHKSWPWREMGLVHNRSPPTAPVAHDAMVTPRHMGWVYQVLHKGSIVIGQVPRVMRQHLHHFLTCVQLQTTNHGGKLVLYTKLSV